jgi:hypothetical protein
MVPTGTRTGVRPARPGARAAGAALGVTFAHRCADSTGPDAHRQAGTDCCHSDFAEFADPVRRSAQELTAAIGGRWVTG